MADDKWRDGVRAQIAEANDEAETHAELAAEAAASATEATRNGDLEEAEHSLRRGESQRNAEQAARLRASNLEGNLGHG